MIDLSSLYQEVILDHSKHPRHFHTLDPCDYSATGHNPLCGDHLKIFARVTDNVIREISFIGDGCAISKASASLLTDIAREKTIEEFSALYQTFHQLVTSRDPISSDIGKLAALIGVRDYPSRVKCATLSWHTLDAALHHQDSAKTE